MLPKQKEGAGVEIMGQDPVLRPGVPADDTPFCNVQCGLELLSISAKIIESEPGEVETDQEVSQTETEGSEMVGPDRNCIVAVVQGISDRVPTGKELLQPTSGRMNGCRVHSLVPEKEQRHPITSSARLITLPGTDHIPAAEFLQQGMAGPMLSYYGGMKHPHLPEASAREDSFLR
jgi:hypothetical protein